MENNIIFSRVSVGWAYSRILIANNNNLLIETDTNNQYIGSFHGQDFNNDIFYNIVITRSGDNFNLYLDGNFVETKTTINADTLTINRVGNNDGYGYSGLIDEIMVWNRALNSSEISDIYSYF